MSASHDLKTVPEYFFHTCEKIPSRPAQRFNANLYQGDNNGRFTYADMRARVENIACGLMSLGMAKGGRVALMSCTTPYWTQVDMAVASCAGVVVTVYSTLSAGEAAFILADSGSRFLFVDTVENLQKIKDRMGELPGLETIVVMDFSHLGNDGKVMGLLDLMERGRAWKREHMALFRERVRGVALDDWYTILYTSGTTGRGKGVILTHRSVSSRIEGVKAFFSRGGMEITHDDVTLCYLPLSHIFERGSCELLALSQGACIAYADKPATLLQDMQRYNPTWINCVPRLYEKIYVSIQEKMGETPLRKRLFDLALHAGRKALDYRRDHRGTYNMLHPAYELETRLPFGLKVRYKLADRLFANVRALFGTRFRFAFSASAGISPDLLLFFYTLGIPVVEGYGSTETASACILNPLTACKPGYMGIEACGSQARLAEDGELEIRGAGLFAGYLGLPEDTGESFTEDGWFKTGDIAKTDDYGYFRMVDRKKAIICTAVGKNIAPAKLESLFALSRVIEQVFFAGDERNYITALVVPNFAFFIDLFDKEGIAYDRGALRYSELGGVRTCTEVGADFVNQPRLKALIGQDVDEVNSRLEDFERVRRHTIIASSFTE